MGFVNSEISQEGDMQAGRIIVSRGFMSQQAARLTKSTLLQRTYSLLYFVCIDKPFPCACGALCSRQLMVVKHFFFAVALPLPATPSTLLAA
ncbi:MAG: hypothetical protein ACI90V_001965 [Bacillariaceae sp.]|jgi:hypothetical protein